MNELELHTQLHSSRHSINNDQKYNDEYYDSKNIDMNSYDRMLLGDSKIHCIVNLGLSIVYAVLALIFLLTLRSFLSVSLFTVALLNLASTVLHIQFFHWEIKKTNWYTTYLYFNDLIIWALNCFTIYLAVNCGSIYLPIQTLASDKAQWIRHYFGYELSYSVVNDLTIAFVVLLVLLGIGLGISSLVLFYAFVSTGSERFDRAIGTWVIFESLFAVGLGFMLMLNVTWTVYYFAIILAITVLLTVAMMIGYSYYGIYRHEYEQKDTLNKVIGFSTVTIMVLHLILAIIVFCNQSKFYLKSYVDFANNFDESIVTSLLFESKFYGTGSLNELSYCPKELLMPNWENASKPFGCLNLQAYYKGRSMTSFILDLTIMLPFFDLMALILLYNMASDIDDLNDPVKNTVLYKTHQEKFRFGFAIVFPILSLGVIIAFFFFKNVSASFPQITVNHLYPTHTSITDAMFAPKSLIVIDNSKEYSLTGTLVSLGETTFSLILAPEPDTEPSSSQTQQVTTNSPFSFKALHAYEKGKPRFYSLKTDKTLLLTFAVGGLLTGKSIDLGDIPIDESIHRGTVKGTVRDSQQVDLILKAVEVWIVKGMYYPDNESNIFSNNTQFSIPDFLNYTLSNLNGEFEIDNLPFGYYTLIFSKDRYYLETHQVSISKKGETITKPVFLTLLTPRYTLSIALEWPRGPKDLDLLLTFPVSDKAVCSVGYLNNCGGAEHIVQNNIGGNKGIEMIQIKDIGDFDYSFSVYHFNNANEAFIKDKYVTGLVENKGTGDVDISDALLKESKARVKVYVPELRLPVVNAQVPTALSGNEWKVFRFNVKKGLEFIELIE